MQRRDRLLISTRLDEHLFLIFDATLKNCNIRWDKTALEVGINQLYLQDKINIYFEFFDAILKNRNARWDKTALEGGIDY